MSDIWFWTKIVATAVWAVLAVLLPVILWVGIGHYYLQFPLDVTFLAYIAVQMTAIAVRMTTPGLAQVTPESRDFYVVTNESYRWDPAKNVVRPRTAKPGIGGTIYAYDTLLAQLAGRSIFGQHKERSQNVACD